MSRVRVVAAIIEHDGKVLACRRAKHKSLAGLWEFPGGKVEPGESDQDALAREIREELGVEVIVGDYLETSISRTGDLDIELVAYRATVIEGVVESSSDHDQLRWTLPQSLAQLEWAPADLPFLSLVSSVR